MANILLVEDNPMIMETFSLLLETFEHNVLKAVNGNEAVDHLRWNHNNFDLIISDYNMDPGNGLYVLKELRKIKKQEELPFILHTGTVDPEIQNICEKLGGTYCDKTSGKLVEIVEHLLKK